MRLSFIHLWLVTLLLSLGISAQADPAANRAALHQLYGPTVYQTPTVHPEPDMDKDGIKAIYYDALPYEEKPTRVFAYLGIPKDTINEKLPAMVLVHGGGGTAFHEWVRIWNDKGYVAIAMDLEGQLPEGNHPNRKRHEFSGPLRTGMFDDQDKPRDQQWMYHAVADIMIANSLLRSQENVDPDRIGLTGISWGGVLTSLTAGMDDRFVFSAPVYGCGYLYDSRGYFNRMGAEDDATLEKRKYWDPARFFTDAPIPTLWVNGDNDPHFSVDTMDHSHQSAGPDSTLSIHPQMAHGHSPAWIPAQVPEIYAMADYLLKGEGVPLARITAQPKALPNGTVTMSYQSESPIVSTSLYSRSTPIKYAMSEKKKHLDLVEQWQKNEASVDSETSTVTAQLPEGCTQYYINITDERGCIVSSNLRTPASK